MATQKIETPETPEVQSQEPTHVNGKPFEIKIAAVCHAAFEEAVVHARNGYTFSGGPIEIASNGWAFFSMVQGSPNDYAIMKAKESVTFSLEQEERDYRKDVEAAAKRLVEQQKREEIAKLVAEEVAAHEEKIKALEKKKAAVLATLNT